jgi:hypothetical protein
MQPKDKTKANNQPKSDKDPNAKSQWASLQHH